MPGLRRWTGYAVWLLGMWAIWLSAVAWGGAVVSAHLFHFDAIASENWTALRRYYLSGGVIPFDFVAAMAGLVLLAFVGCAVLTSHVERIRVAAAAASPDVGWWRDRPGFPRFPHFPRFRRHQARRARPDHSGSFGAARAGALALKAVLVATALRLRRKSTGRVMNGAVPPQDDVAGAFPMTAPTGPAPAVEHPPASRDKCPDSTRGDARRASETTPAAARLEGAGKVAPALAEDGAPVASSDADLAVFERIQALFEVWSDPAPAWMRDAVREELDMLSDAGWGLFSQFGEPATGRLAAVVAAGIVPSRSESETAARAIVEERRFQLEAAAVRAGDWSGRDSEDVEALPSSPSPGPARLAMNAAWLCELVDNFLLLEEIRDAGRGEGAAFFEEHWGGVYRETEGRLKVAMQAMTDEDWKSIDQFPDRAGHIRVQTDRLREQLRAPHALADRRPLDGTVPAPPRVDPPSGDSQAATDSPSEVSGPAEEGSEFRPPAAAASFEALLDAAGYVVRRLPPDSRTAGGDEDYLVRRAGVSLLLRVADLNGGDWRVNGDSLAPWRGAEGQIIPSPCRALWQRLALMRTRAGETGPTAALLLLKGGQLADEPAAAGAIGRDRPRTGIDVAWLDRPGSALPDLSTWLARM